MEVFYPMNTAEASQEIADLNLTYMLLAQKLLKKDRAGAMLLLGISDELADILVSMTLSQLVKLAANNFLLCAFRLNEIPAARVLDQAKTPALQQAHISIVLASARNAARLAMAA